MIQSAGGLTYIWREEDVERPLQIILNDQGVPTIKMRHVQLLVTPGARLHTCDILQHPNMICHIKQAAVSKGGLLLPAVCPLCRGAG